MELISPRTVLNKNQKAALLKKTRSGQRHEASISLLEMTSAGAEPVATEDNP